MSFKEINVNKIIEEKCNESLTFKKEWDESREEYRLIGEMIKIRKEKEMTQTQLANLTGNRQQVISRIEKQENSPTLRTFCNILDVLGYELKITKKV